MRRRQGFTLVEMLVSMALIVFIMVILTQAFAAGMDGFRRLKTIGDLEEKLRLATTILRKDLTADHFEGKKRLSDPNFWNDGPPREGFFRIWQGGPSVLEGVDGDGLPSHIATNHILHFTVKLRGNRREAFASVGVPAGSLLSGTGLAPDSRFQAVNSFASQWYQVAYFLAATGETTDGSVPRYNLYRRQQLAVCDNATINWTKGSQIPSTQYANYYEVCCERNTLTANPQALFFSSPRNLTIPLHRFGMANSYAGGVPSVQPKADPKTWTYPTLAQAAPLNAGLVGSDLLASDVISFQVQVDTTGAGLFGDLPAGNNVLLNQLGVGVFDTWSQAKDEWSQTAATRPPDNDSYDYRTWNTARLSNNQTPNPKVVPSLLTIKAIKITLRVWDLKSQQTRQITLIQDM